ncbi:MAG: phytanoyl-CoA dioxygenase family protein [Pseudomonadota bacterium]
MQPLTDSTDIVDNAEALRVRAEADGYLFVRGLLSHDAVSAVAQALADIMADHGWIASGAPIELADVSPDHQCVEPQPPFMDVFYEMLSQRCVHALKADSALINLFGALFDEAPLCTPHCVMRMAFPDMDAYATPAHQDYVHFEGSQRNWAAWIPFVPINHVNGGLAIAAGSHRHGAYDMRPTLGAGQMIIDADLSALDWRWSPMVLGDVLIHNCLTVHRGLPNRSPNMRVSMDARYQPLAEPIGEKYLGVSHQMKDWDDLYRGWTGDEFKYYWKTLNLDVVAFSYHWYDRRDERAIEMGEAGDREATVALENIVLKHRDPDMRARATAALASLNATAD